jgi:hypothetical protein
MIARIAVVTSALLLGAVVVFQLVLVLGAPWGQVTQGGAVAGALPAPNRVIAAVSAAILIAFILGLLGRIGWGPLRARPRVAAVLAWVFLGYAVVAVALNAATPSAQERAVWLPVSVVLLLTSSIAVIGTRRPKAK